jgi:glycosyltransferase involved in cell wall biosynthesis
VLQDDPGPEAMQIEVVDDASTRIDLEPLVQAVGRGRVGFRRNPQNLGQARNLNRCLDFARGKLIHLLHADDFVLPEFYSRMAAAAARFPDAGLIACRSFLTDHDGAIVEVMPRVPALETGGRDVSPFFYTTPIQFAGTVVRREAYEVVGGWSPSLESALDREMWTRLIASRQGVVLEDVRSCYRLSKINTTARVARNGERAREFLRLNQHFAAIYKNFSLARGTRVIALEYWDRYLNCLRAGDQEGAAINWRLWTEFAPPWLWVRRAVKFWTQTRWKLRRTANGRLY